MPVLSFMFCTDAFIFMLGMLVFLRVFVSLCSSPVGSFVQSKVDRVRVVFKSVGEALVGVMVNGFQQLFLVQKGVEGFLEVVADATVGSGGGVCMYILCSGAARVSEIIPCWVFEFVNTGAGGGERSDGRKPTSPNAVS